MSDVPLLQALRNLSPEKRAMLVDMLRTDAERSGVSSPAEPLAIIGLACRFPGRANNPDQFWELLLDGRDAVTTVPADRWPMDDYYDPEPAAPGKINSPYGAFIDGVDQFDAAFFGISPREALRMDPQQRLLLEVAWEALENAGQSQSRLSGSATGVFVGIYQSDYSWRQFADVNKVDAYVASGMSHAIAANRLSFLFDLRGPSVAMDTACSSSLVAFHMACQSLRQQECDMAIIAGVNLMLSPLSVLPIAKWGMMAPDGRCKTFDAAADGFGRGEGCGVLIVKRLADARRDGDPILALCRGSAVNQDGRTNVLTAPSGLAQKAVIAQALANAGLEGHQISYIEAHGTGTALGDPIEMEALVETVGHRPAGKPCYIGSVKTNIGHLEAAAGVAGLIKTVLAMQNQTIPANLHFRQLNPHIELGDVPFVLPASNQPWPADDGEPRRAGVSAFGFGGTNAHVILEEAPPASLPEGISDLTQTVPQLLVLSAPQAAALPELAAAYEGILARGDALPHLCRGAAQRRTHFAHRLAVAGRTSQEIIAALAEFRQGLKPSLLHIGRRTAGIGDGLVFAYGGQGSQWVGMGRRLLEMGEITADTDGLSPFLVELQRYETLFEAQGLPSIMAELQAPPESSRLQETILAQPAIFALQMALTAEWRAWGYRPAAVVGHSLGEISAATAAGILAPEEAVQVVVARSRLMQRLTGQGKMAVISRPAAELEPYLSTYPGLALAAVNAAQETVVAGDGDQLDDLLARCQAAGMRCQLLPVNYAFHSPQVAPLVPQLVGELQAVKLAPKSGTIPFYSTVIGDVLPGNRLDAIYWGQNMGQPVRFGPAVDRLIAAGHRAFLEISPHPVLRHYIQGGLAAAGQEGVVAGSLRRDRDDYLTLLANLGQLYTAGFDPDWAVVLGTGGASPTRLPNYPWQHRRYWLEEPGPPIGRPAGSGRSGGHPLLAQRISSPMFDGVVFETPFSGQSPAFQGDHRIYDTLVVPATAYLEMADAAAKAVFGPGPHHLQELLIRDALLVPDEEQVILQLAISDLQPVQGETSQPAQATFQIYARPVDGSEQPRASSNSEGWQLYVRGRISAGPVAAGHPAEFDLDRIRARCPEEMDGQSYYEHGRELGGQLGPRFLSIDRLWRPSRETGELGEVLGRLVISPLLYDEWPGYTLHPAFMDAAFHIAYAAQSDEMAAAGILMPVSFEDVCYFRAPSHYSEPVWCHFTLRPEGDARTPLGDVSLYESTGGLLARIRGVRYLRAAAGQLRPDRPRPASAKAVTGRAPANWLYEITWQPGPLGRPVAQAGAVNGTGSQSGRGWLILDSGHAGQALAELLRGRGHPAIVEKPTLQGPTGYQDLLAACAGQIPAGFDLVYLARQRDGVEPDELDRLMAHAVRDELLPALYLAQAALKSKPPVAATPTKLWLVTQLAVGIESGPAEENAGQPSRSINLPAAPLWGFGRALALEHPAHWGGLIDLDELPAAETAVLLAAELLQPDGEQQIAWRDGRRLVARLAPWQPEAARPDVPIRPQATYLITGASGGIGRELVRWLVKKGARHLALWSRQAPTWLDQARQAHPKVDFVYEPVDLGQPKEVAAAWASLQAGQPTVRGILHAAGVVADGAVLGLSAGQFSQVLPAKVNGGWQLHRLTSQQGTPLDFMLFFSSGAAVLGSPGQSNYAAANQFLDALAHHRRGIGLPATSVNWGPWDVGMSAAAGHKGQRRWQAWGLGQITMDQAGELLPHLLGQAAAQIAVLPLTGRPAAAPLDPARQPYFQALVAAVRPPAGSAAPPAERLRAGGTSQQLARHLAQQAGPRRRQILLGFLQEQIRLVLGWDGDYEIDLHQGLFDIGFDSLTAVELKERIDAALGLAQPLPATLAFDYPTLADLLTYLLSQIPAPPDLVPAAEPRPLPVAEEDENGRPGDDLDSLSEAELATGEGEERP